MDTDVRHPKENWHTRNEVLPQDSKNLIQRPDIKIEVCRQIEDVGSPFENLLTTVKRWKLQWYGHVTLSNGLAKTVLQGTLQGGRKHGCQHMKWINNVKEWSGLSTAKMNAAAIDRQKWQNIMKSLVPLPP